VVDARAKKQDKRAALYDRMRAGFHAHCGAASICRKVEDFQLIPIDGDGAGGAMRAAAAAGAAAVAAGAAADRMSEDGEDNDN
jgi:hypothetical protein